MNPELRHTLNTISRNIESANETAQENIYTFTQSYIDPCLSNIKTCVRACVAPCFPSREDQLRRKRGRSRGRAELSFDFYEDWDVDEDTGDGLMGWGNDELDRLLAGTSNRAARDGQPPMQRAMSYGSRGRRTSILPSDDGADPTVIPSSSYLGFLERLPWRLGGRGLRYKPSAADLQENPGGLRDMEPEGEPLLEGSDEDEGWKAKSRSKHRRKRSDTAASQSTQNSLSSRGDLIPSDEEDDAVPLGDEFAVALERRTTGQGADDRSSGKTGSGKRPAMSRTSTGKSGRPNLRNRPQSPDAISTEDRESPSVMDLHREEEAARKEEEHQIERKREVAQELARARGLSAADAEHYAGEIKPEEPPAVEDVLTNPNSDESKSAGEVVAATSNRAETTSNLSSSGRSPSRRLPESDQPT